MLRNLGQAPIAVAEPFSEWAAPCHAFPDVAPAKRARLNVRLGIEELQHFPFEVRLAEGLAGQRGEIDRLGRGDWRCGLWPLGLLCVHALQPTARARVVTV